MERHEVVAFGERGAAKSELRHRLLTTRYVGQRPDVHLRPAPIARVVASALHFWASRRIQKSIISSEGGITWKLLHVSPESGA
jgi:hypothetical protein